MRFSSTVLLGGKTATGIVVPDEVVAALGESRKPAVTVSVNGHTYRSTVAVRDGRFLIPLSAENRTAAGVGAGDDIEVEVELDTAPREVEVPADFAAALKAEPEAGRFFQTLSFSQQSGYVIPIEQAKAQETRERRIEKAIAKLRAGQKS
jgi:hypothetical protein